MLLPAVPVFRRSVDDYRCFVGDALVENLFGVAKPLAGCRVLHLSAVPSRPGLADTVDALTSLLQSVGLTSEWRVVRIKPNRAAANRILNRALDGQFVQWTPELRDLWQSQDDDLAGISSEDYDFVVVHGAEIAGAFAARISQASRPKWIWHCHSDLSKAQPDVWDFLILQTRWYHSRIVSSLQQDSADIRYLFSTVPPTVDPLGARNLDLPDAFVEMMVRQHGVHPEALIVLSIQRRDQSSGIAFQVAQGFRLAKARIPELQLLVLLVGDEDRQTTLPHAAPTRYGAVEQPDICFVPAGSRSSDAEVNALQRAAVALLDDSDDDGLALNLLEVMWKARPVVTGGAGAVRLGIQGGRNGCVARSAEEYCRAIVDLVKLPGLAAAIGQAAKEHVRDNFLVTRLLSVYLTTLRELARPPVAATSDVVAKL